ARRGGRGGARRGWRAGRGSGTGGGGSRWSWRRGRCTRPTAARSSAPSPVASRAGVEHRDQAGVLGRVDVQPPGVFGGDVGGGVAAPGVPPGGAPLAGVLVALAGVGAGGDGDQVGGVVVEGDPLRAAPVAGAGA